ncbi:tight junction-associated protein 1 [Protopterus annectens]|uniref:tight junction-associated protein 1 n=1 Tax=Protopterus annectens TaxID=7888 RepID=UPI001CFB5FBA|nr:tight junction-associated protein 1 [Protopterus annectens]XP_043916996.1 tight junction-associated protein 1 [Protopterus annectens]XP_043917005.1 tight junction-associated protein 1 [Protopterus annectens]
MEGRMTNTAPVRKPYRKAPPQHREMRHEHARFEEDEEASLPSEHYQLEHVSDAEKIKLLQQENEELRQCLAHTTHRAELMESDFAATQHYMEVELGRNRDEFEKLKDKFRRLQNSYTASQRATQDLEEKLHVLIKRTEMEKKTLDWEIVELTNKLLDAKTTIDKLEELNERYRLDCNLAVQLLKCNKSHFRNHKFADLPYELQDMINKHIQTSSDSSSTEKATEQCLAPSDVVPTSVIARVLEKPEPLVLNSAKSSSGDSHPLAEDVFVHVDMSGSPGNIDSGLRSAGKENDGRQNFNGLCRRQNSNESYSEEVATFEKLSPYPTPPPPHPGYPGRKIIEFSSDDKVKIPKNSPLPNCTYATRQAISLSLVQGDEDGLDRNRTLPSSPASEGRRSAPAASWSYQHSSKGGATQESECELRSSQSSPFNSPPQVPSAFASSASSEEDILANWQRMFVEKIAPTSERTFINRTSFSRETAQELKKNLSKSMQELGEERCAYSDGEDSVQSCRWAVSRDSSLDTDSTELRPLKSHSSPECGRDPRQDEGSRLLQASSVNELSSNSTSVSRQRDFVNVGSAASSAEEREALLQESVVISATPVGEDELEQSPPPPPRQQKSPKRMGVHHLHRKDSLTRAQEHGNLLN